MDIIIAFIIFIILMGISVATGISMILPLVLGFILFTRIALKSGFTFKDIMSFAKESLKESFIVVGIMLIIGCLTGMWRASGTVAYFITYGLSLIPPHLFILASFLLASIMSFALGTSFGVSATAGVILMSIARAGGVNPVFAAGAILSGIYFGDRGSPAASSANLVAVLTHTDMRKNIRTMLNSSIIPYIICIIIYAVLSFISPMKTIDSDIIGLLNQEFNLNWLCVIPGVLMIVLPFLKVKIKLSMVISLISSALVAIVCQNSSLVDCLKAMIFGYSAINPSLNTMLSGGGVVSMLEVSAILIISCSYGKIFQATGMLNSVNEKIVLMGKRIGRFTTMIVTGLMVSMIFCNQTIGAIMQSSLTKDLYTEDEKYIKMIDMENSVILLSAMVPWCIACSVPMKMIGSDIRGIPFTCYLWLVPLFWFFKNKHKA